MAATGGTLRITILRQIPEESPLLARWNELALQMERTQVVYTCEWALAVQAAYGAALKPLIFLGYDGNELAGVACLATDPSGQKVSFLTATTGDYCEFLSAARRRTEFVDAVFAELRKLNLGTLVLANLPVDSATPEALRAAARNHGFYLHMRPAYLCPEVTLGSPEQRQQFKTFVTKKRQYRRCVRELERRGSVTMTYLRSWPQIKAALPGFIKALLNRFQAHRRTSFLSTPERQLFMDELARRLSSNGMTFSILMVAGQPVAWSFGFQYQEAWFLYQTTFDIDWEEHSPGYCLLGRILIEACDTSALERVDLGLGSEAYKEWFANSSRQTLYAALTTSPLRHVREAARYRVATEVKRSPRIEAAIRNALSRLKS